MTDMVHKRSGHDSLVCCMAMALSRSWEDVVASMPYVTEASLSHMMILEMFQKLGLVKHVHYEIVPHSLYVDVQNAIKQMLWGRRGIIRVRIKGEENKFEFMYWDGATLFDPKEFSGHKWLEFKPSTVWIFKETPK